MNNFGPGLLEWIPSNLSKMVVMLDLVIIINKQGYIQHRTYQKDLNLYAYVLQSSAHPLGMLRVLVISQAVRYWNQNILLSNFCVYTNLFYQPLKCRGYLYHKLEPVFMEAEQHINHTNGISTNIQAACKKTTLINSIVPYYISPEWSSKP